MGGPRTRMLSVSPTLFLLPFAVPNRLDFQIMNTAARVRRAVEARDTGAQKSDKLRMWAKRDRAGATRAGVLAERERWARYSEWPVPQLTEEQIRLHIRQLKARAARRSKAADVWTARHASADADIRAVVRTASPEVLAGLLGRADEQVRLAVIASL